MIKEFIKAWDKNKELLLKEFEKQSPDSYEDIVKRLVNTVINPYLIEHTELEYPMSAGLRINDMTVIDDGDYQGTTIYVIPFDTYQPETSDYVFTNNYYGSCSGCDTFLGIEEDYDLYDENDKKAAAKEFQTLALHLLQSFKWLNNEDKGEDNPSYGE